MNKSKIYLIEWHDAHSAAGWHTDEEMKKFINQDKCIAVNVGWILNETKDEIVIGSRTLKWNDKDTCEWGMLQKIPKAWIKKKVIYKFK